MFIRNVFLSAALLAGVAIVYSVPKSTGKVAPLSASDSKLKTCELHGTALKVENVPITYGITTGWPAGYYQASERAFPRVKSRVGGGCVVSSDSPRLQAVKFCPKCRLAEKSWFDAHKKAVAKR